MSLQQLAAPIDAKLVLSILKKRMEASSSVMDDTNLRRADSVPARGLLAHQLASNLRAPAHGS